MQGSNTKFLVSPCPCIIDFLVFGHLTDLLALRRSFNEYDCVTAFYSSMNDLQGV